MRIYVNIALCLHIATSSCTATTSNLWWMTLYFAMTLLKTTLRTTGMEKMEMKKEIMTPEPIQNKTETMAFPRLSPRLNQIAKRRSKRVIKGHVMTLPQRAGSG